MAFLRRLGWYLVGLSIGIVFLVFFLKKKSGENGIELCYFPNCRVLKDMRSKPIVFGEELPQTYRDTLLVRSFLVDGDIDFGKSDTKSNPCKKYLVNKTINGEELAMTAENCDGQIIVQYIGPTN